MEVNPIESSVSGSRKATVVLDSMTLETAAATVSGTTGSSPHGPEGQLLSPEVESKSLPKGTSAILDNMLPGSATASGMTVSSLDEPTSELVLCGLESGLENVEVPECQSGDRPKPRVRKVSDVIDSFVLGSKASSPAYLNERSPLPWYPSSSSQSSTSSKDATKSTVSSTHGQSRIEGTSPLPGHYIRDLLEHPLTSSKSEQTSFIGAFSGVGSSDEIDARPPGREKNEDDFREPPKPTDLRIENVPLVEALMPAEPDDEEYNMGHRRRGVAVIFNNDKFSLEPERSGSAADVTALREALSHLGFGVKEHHNLTRSEIGKELDQLVKVDFDDCDCFCMAVLTHGEAPELLHANDGVYRETELWTPFIAEKCPKLAGKPKIFFIQACRGEGLDRGVRLVRYSADSSQTDGCSRRSYVIPSWADFLIAHSSVEGFFAWRNPAKGTWWIQTLCEELKSRSSTCDLVKILTIVQRRVALEFESFVLLRPDLSGCREIPSFTSSLMRDVYFRPRAAPAPQLPRVTGEQSQGTVPATDPSLQG